MNGARPPAATRIAFLLIGVVAALVAVAPLWWMLVSSVRPSAEIFSSMSPLSWRTWWPDSVTLTNYGTALSSTIARAAVNSIAVTALTVAVGLLVNSMAAFALSTLHVPGQGAIFTVVVLSFMIPFDAVAIPLASLTQQAGLTNSYLALVLPGLGNGLAIFLLRQFFLGIPPEYAEAARLDGAGAWTIYRRLYLPMSRSALVSAGLILFIFQWQAYIWPLLVVSDPAMDMGAVALGRLFGQYGVDWGLVFASAVLLTVVPMVVVLGLQRFLVGSLSQGGLKG